MKQILVSNRKRMEMAFSVQRLAFRAIRSPLLLSAIFLSLGLILYAQETNTDVPAKSETAATTASLSKGTVLRINGDGVTSTDVINPIRKQLAELASRYDRRDFLAKVSPLIAQSAADRVRNILLYQYAKQQLEKNENFEMAIENAMAERRKEFLAQYDGSEARAREELVKYGTSIEDQMKELERSLVVSIYQETFIIPSLEVTRSQMMRYYKKHQREKYYLKSKIQFQLIDIQSQKFLPPANASRPTDLQSTEALAQAKASALEAMKKLQTGADFASVVKEYSHGYRKIYDGLWRPLDPEAIQEQYQPLIQSLENVQVGQTTGIIEADKRFFIAKLVERQNERMIPFSEAQTEVDQILRSQLLAKRSKKMIDDLLKKASIGNLELFIDDVTRLAWDLFRIRLEDSKSQRKNLGVLEP
jgi:parvulin-like peptidyl-prolyl isomerase